MSVVRYECPRCQSVFVPAEIPLAGTYARCPTCGSLSVPAAGPPSDEKTGDETGELTPPPPSAPPTPTAGGVFASLMPVDAATAARVPADETTIPPAADPNATTGEVPVAKPGAGGLFTSLLMSAPDLELSGKRAPIRDPGPPPSVPHEVTLPPNMARAPLTDPSIDQTREVDVPRIAPSGMPVAQPQAPAAHAPGSAPVVSNPWEIAGTGMIQGPVTDPGAAAAAAAAKSARAKAPPPTGDKSLYLDKETFSDEEFESMLGGSFAPNNGAPAPAPSMNGASADVAHPPAPPPLKRPGDVTAPPPIAKKDAQTPAQSVAGLAPIPKVSSLGEVPRLKDGITAVRVGILVTAAVLLGTLAGIAVAPPPPKPPSTGTEGALVKLAEARKLMSRNQDSEAVGALLAALALDKNLAEAHRDLGVAYARQEKFEEAAHAYEVYLELAPKAPDAYDVESTLKQYRAKK